MNNLKIQQEILKAVLANPENVKHYKFENRIGEACTFVTITGAVGYVLRDDDLRVNLSGAQYMSDLRLEGVVREYHRLIGTDEYRLKGLARRYDRQEPCAEPVYVDTSLLKNFENPALFQMPGNPFGIIVVAEEPWDDGNLYVRGVVTPVKVRNEETETDEEGWTE